MQRTLIKPLVSYLISRVWSPALLLHLLALLLHIKDRTNQHSPSRPFRSPSRPMSRELPFGPPWRFLWRFSGAWRFRRLLERTSKMVDSSWGRCGRTRILAVSRRYLDTRTPPLCHPGTQGNHNGGSRILCGSRILSFTLSIKYCAGPTPR